jgi:hypothetical protein
MREAEEATSQKTLPCREIASGNAFGTSSCGSQEPFRFLGQAKTNSASAVNLKSTEKV